MRRTSCHALKTEPARKIPPPKDAPHHHPLLAAALIAVAALIAYANSFSVPFLLDDVVAIKNNPTIQGGSGWSRVLTPQNPTTGGRPVLNLSFALNHGWSGQSPGSYHAINLVIHIAAGLTLLGIVRRTLQSSRGTPAGTASGNPMIPATAIALLWTVHPLQTEAVTYLSQRAESLMGLFYLLTLYCLIRAAASANATGWKTASVLCCFAGMGTKEVMITAPLVVFLYDRAFLSDSIRDVFAKRCGYYLALASSWILLAMLMLTSKAGSRGVGFHAGASGTDYLFTEAKAIALYLKLALWPSPLVFDYGREAMVHGFGAAVLYALLLLIALGAVIVLAIRGKKEAAFLGAAFFILLSPTSSFVPVAEQPIAESRMYLPLAAILALVVIGVQRVLRHATWYALGAVAVAFVALTTTRNRDYQTELKIFEDTVQKRPGNSRAHGNLAAALSQIPGRLPEAIAEYEKAIELNPNSVEAHFNLGNRLAVTSGRAADAVAHYEAALRINPNFAEAHANLAEVLSTNPSRLPDAFLHYEQALRLKPDAAELHARFANKLMRIRDRLPDAIEHFEAVVRLRPNEPEAHYALGCAYALTANKTDAAIEQLETATKLNPNYVQAHNDLAFVLLRSGQRDRALAHVEASLRLKPGNDQARRLLEQIKTGSPPPRN